MCSLRVICSAPFTVVSTSSIRNSDCAQNDTQRDKESENQHQRPDWRTMPPQQGVDARISRRSTQRQQKHQNTGQKQPSNTQREGARQKATRACTTAVVHDDLYTAPHHSTTAPRHRWVQPSRDDTHIYTDREGNPDLSRRNGSGAQPKTKNPRTHSLLKHRLPGNSTTRCRDYKALSGTAATVCPMQHTDTQTHSHTRTHTMEDQKKPTNTLSAAAALLLVSRLHSRVAAGPSTQTLPTHTAQRRTADGTDVVGVLHCNTVTPDSKNGFLQSN